MFSMTSDNWYGSVEWMVNLWHVRMRQSCQILSLRRSLKRSPLKGLSCGSSESRWELDGLETWVESTAGLVYEASRCLWWETLCLENKEKNMIKMKSQRTKRWICFSTKKELNQSQRTFTSGSFPKTKSQGLQAKCYKRQSIFCVNEQQLPSFSFSVYTL